MKEDDNKPPPPQNVSARREGRDVVITWDAPAQLTADEFTVVVKHFKARRGKAKGFPFKS